MAVIISGELRSLLDRFADALEAGKAEKAGVRSLRDISEMFAGYEQKPAAVILKAAGGVHTPVGKSASPLVGNVTALVLSLRAIANELAKKDLNTTLDSLLDALRSNSDVPISAFVASVRQRVASASQPSRKKKGTGVVNQHLIEDYVNRLEAALGDDRRFQALFDDLQADKRISQPEAVAIASRFYGKTSSGTSRAKALARIRERHDKLMEFKKQPSTAGRSAA